MLHHLTIHNFVLIDRVDLSFDSGFTVFTGETGAGKSILLDALGLALGARAQSAMVAKGAPQATITAVLSSTPAVDALLHDHGIECQDALILKRVLDSQGPSRAFINDQPVGLGLLKKIGDYLIEIEGQFDTHRLLEPTEQRHFIDTYGNLETYLSNVRTTYSAWKQAHLDLSTFEDQLNQFKETNLFLKESLQELQDADPQVGEDLNLNQKRTLLKNQQHFAQSLTRVQDLLEGEQGMQASLYQALSEITRVAPKGEGALDPLLIALQRTSAELEEALIHLQSFDLESSRSEDSLEKLEDRLHTLRRLARKHGVAPDDLPALKDTLQNRLVDLENSDDTLAHLTQTLVKCHNAYQEAAQILHEQRKLTAQEFDKRVMKELPPLKLEKAQFKTVLTHLPESQWGPLGFTNLTFEIAPNPGTPSGPLDRVASGGELSRLKLAIRVVLHDKLPKSTLIFDEIDSGMGGATADAVGERLKRLSLKNQVIAVTHSPQVAAKSDAHWLVTKASLKDQTLSHVIKLDLQDQIQEIARMLSGAEVTDEATAAARKLKGALAA